MRETLYKPWTSNNPWWFGGSAALVAILIAFIVLGLIFWVTNG